MLLTNGIYAHHRDGDSVHLLRFYADGRVISLSIGQGIDARTLAEWLQWDDYHPAKGNYTIEGKSVAFATAHRNDDRDVVIDHTGVMPSSRELVIDSKSYEFTTDLSSAATR